jgi:transcriptional regulator with XRE-family HTH domain
MAWGWTQEELGRSLNTDQTAVSTWERDKVKPSGAALAAITQLFGMEPEELEGREFKVPPIPSTTSVARGTPYGMPDVQDAAVVLIDAKKGEAKGLDDAQEVILRVIQAVQKGRKVWVVINE